jgi:hypothetical protein
MRIITTAAGYNHWDHKINEEMMRELNILQITGFIAQYRNKLQSVLAE